MKRATALLTTYGAVVLPAIVVGVGFVEAAQPAGSTYELQVTGRADVPSDATAVVLNVTSAEARGTGYITAWPCGEARPNASNLNYGVGAPVANSAIVKIGAGGKVCLFTADADTELIADVNGWFASSSGYTSKTPARLLDTRRALSTIDGANAGQGMRRAGSTYELQVTGRADVPASATAVVLNVTSAEARGTGFVTAWPCGEALPTASNLNYGVGAPVANSAIVKIGAGGKVCLLTADTDTQLIADVNGWFTSASGYTSMTPSRLLDTRGTSSAAFVETFTGNTGLQRFRTQVHYRNLTIGSPEGHGGTWQADHDLACGGADTLRDITTSPGNVAGVAQVVYTCRDHFMTSVGEVDGYSVVSVAPNQTFPTVSRVCWDVNVTNMGNRQWTEVAVVPAGAAAGRIVYVTSDFFSVDESVPIYPAGSIVVANQGNELKFYNGATKVGGRGEPGDPEGFASKAIRRQKCMTENGNGTITYTQFVGSGTSTHVFDGSFPDNAVVLFTDHDYTPDKSETPFTRPAYTWHWDNIIVQ
jgi:hypothetical protein